MAAQITDAAISAEHVSLEVLAPARGGGVSVVACPLKSAVFVLRSGTAPAALLLSPGRVDEQTNIKRKSAVAMRVRALKSRRYERHCTRSLPAAASC